MQNLPKPFLGRILTEALDDDVEAHLKEKAGIGKNSLIQLPEDYKKKHSIPVQKGRIIDLAPDAFGEAFQNKYGNIGPTPGLGDIVMFLPGQSFKVDIEAKYHIVGDEDIIAWFNTENKDTKEEVRHE